MFYGLSFLEDDFFAKHLHKVVQFAPCFYTANPNNDTKESVADFMGLASENEFNALFGPNWDRDFKRICDKSSDKKFPDQSCSDFEMMAQYGGQAMSWKTMMHFG